MTRIVIVLLILLTGNAAVSAGIPDALLRLAETPDSLLDEASRIRAEWVRTERQKNPVGSKASNFKFIDRHSGQVTSLHELHPTDGTTLLFYDPNCDTCHELMASLADRPVIAIAIEGQSDEWLADAMSLPAAWTVGFAVDDIEELYAIWEIPTAITLSSDFTVTSE